MCGVVGLICKNIRPDLGKMAATLLRSLEYRGYDSTGAAIQGDDPHTVDLRKGVGAPSLLVDDLGISHMTGRMLCGQVRWATFGAVDEKNAQPHVVRCKTFLYGAHNGNVTNTEAIREKLLDEGHVIVSDNDGEMLVHLVEHHFALELQRVTNPFDRDTRRQAMRKALVRTQAAVEGSFAAIIADPISYTLWALKSGSSLYFGIGYDENGPFQLASSDLSSILKFTRVLLPLEEGEAVEFDHEHRVAFMLKEKQTRDGRTLVAGEMFSRSPVRSRLRARDTELSPEFSFFMEQEIYAQAVTAHAVITKYTGGSAFVRMVQPVIGPMQMERIRLMEALARLSEITSDAQLEEFLHELLALPESLRLIEAVKNANVQEFLELPVGNEALASTFSSSEAAVFADMLHGCRNADARLAVRLFDAVVELQEIEETTQTAARFAEIINTARAHGNHIYVAACGSSYHAALAACLFFNDIAFTELIPILPGEFRGRYSNTVRDHDVVIAVTQSGETKDLIDILDDITATGRRVQRIAIVNNINSTIAIEKSDLVIPLRCGPEIAVPATKSFINQITVFYTLALETSAYQITHHTGEWDAAQLESRRQELAQRREKLTRIPELIERTLHTTADQVDAAAARIFLAPSIQLLATRISAVAKEGALKIREVVLNHTEGFEGAEFKHGPNTILGYNTVFGPEHLFRAIGMFTEKVQSALTALSHQELGFAAARRLVDALGDYARGNPPSFSLTTEEQRIFDELVRHYKPLSGFAVPYPLIYISGPQERDVRLTISQLNTHKIRGSGTIVIAEENPRLRQTAEKPPAGQGDYWSVYITLPRTDDSLLPVFTATLVVQMLALRMSVRKMKLLDELGISDHGVHPDVPKNVSKSITVD